MPREDDLARRTAHRPPGRIATHVHPHLLRHAFAEHVTRCAGLRTAQAVLGHATIQTTEGYLAKPSLDELARATATLTFGALPDANLEHQPERRDPGGESDF